MNAEKGTCGTPCGGRPGRRRVRQDHQAFKAAPAKAHAKQFHVIDHIGELGFLDRLHDKRVAVIGTGATAIQCVPFVGETAKQLYVFQRTPSTVDVRGNQPTDPEWAGSLKPGWQKHRMENFNGLVSGVPQTEDLVDDGWTDLVGKMIRRFREAVQDGRPDVPAILEMANFEKMTEIRDRVDALVEDPEVAEKLKPMVQN